MCTISLRPSSIVVVSPASVNFSLAVIDFPSTRARASPARPSSSSRARARASLRVSSSSLRLSSPVAPHLARCLVVVASSSVVRAEQCRFASSRANCDALPARKNQRKSTDRPTAATRRRAVDDATATMARARAVTRAVTARTPTTRARRATARTGRATARTGRATRASDDDDAKTSTSATTFDAATAVKLADAETVRVANDGHADARIPATAGVYAVYDERDALQYVGLSRKVNASVKVHAFEMPQYCYAVKCMALPDASKADLQAAWKTWVMEHVTTAGGLPPGNAPGNKLFSERRARPSKACLRLSDGKTPQMTADALKEAIGTCVREHKIVAFIKGTREEPDCGFSHRMINVLNELMVDYDTVNVLDDYYNPNLLFVIKDFSDWPTIPQLYVDGELLGGHDIVNSMHESGELKAQLGA
jgi:Grx4 family monothiol glutaredoxin